MNVLNPSYAKYFENTIPAKDLLAFTCEEKSDVSLLLEELHRKKGLRINVIHSPAAKECEYSCEPISQIRFGKLILNKY